MRRQIVMIVMDKSQKRQLKMLNRIYETCMDRFEVVRKNVLRNLVCEK